MSETRKQKAVFGGAFLRWLRTVPGLRAVRMPPFGKEAGWTLLSLFGLLDLVHSNFLIHRIVVWIAFWCVSLPFAAVYLYRIGQTIQRAAFRLRNLPPPNQWSGQNALLQFFVTLPRLMLFLWFIIHLHLFKVYALWINYAALLVWINYFAVGCAVALRRGVDDLVRSRKRAI